MSKRRLAAIDVGTNTIRCIVVEGSENGSFKILDDEKATVRLGRGLAATGAILPEAWEQARDALLRMRKITDGLGVEAVEAVATSAVRNASNGTAFLDAVARDSGVQIRVIGGDEEAELAVRSALRHFNMANTRYALVDIGGGSVEIVSAAGSHIEDICSLDLGAVFLTETFLLRDPIPDRDFRRLRKHVRKTLRQGMGQSDHAPQCLIGSGGTMTSIGSMAMALRKENYDSVHGYEVLRSEVVHLLAMLQRKNHKERKAVPGLSPERADIIVAGVAVVDQVMRFFDTNILRINERGIREGLILKGLEKHRLVDVSPASTDWRTSVESFARSCHVEEAHGHQVKDLALKMFDALSREFQLDPRSRDMLEAAALLHDVGYFIGYSKHHKHSYHLICHANLYDFSPREKQIIANVARYHRKAHPKKKHETFAKLAAPDQDLVRKLGALLRLADGLDRSRSSRVEFLRCSLTEQTFSVVLDGEDDLSVELHGGMTKGDLFEPAFGRRLVLAVGGDATGC